MQRWLTRWAARRMLRQLVGPSAEPLDLSQVTDGNALVIEAWLWHQMDCHPEAAEVEAWIAQPAQVRLDVPPRDAG